MTDAGLVGVEADVGDFRVCIGAPRNDQAADAFLQAGEEGVPAEVLTLAFTGPIARYTVAVEDGPVLTVDLPNPGPDQFFGEGTSVSLQLPDEVPSLLG